MEDNAHISLELLYRDPDPFSRFFVYHENIRFQFDSYIDEDQLKTFANSLMDASRIGTAAYQIGELEPPCYYLHMRVETIEKNSSYKLIIDAASYGVFKDDFRALLSITVTLQELDEIGHAFLSWVENDGGYVDWSA
jgi:hypothetical protein